MKDLYFAADLLTVFRHDKYYSVQKNMSVALRKFGLSSVERTDNSEQMLHALVVQIMDQRGETEAFLSGTFIYPESVVQLLKDNGLPAPSALLPAGTTKGHSKEPLDEARLEQHFNTVCSKFGTVTDPLATAYRTPIGRLIFRTFLETRREIGINATARYVLEHLENFDNNKIVVSVSEDSVIWRTDDSKEKLTSVQTIAKFVLCFNREIETVL